MMRHIKPTTIAREDYLQNGNAEANRLLDYFTYLFKSDQYNRTETEEKVSVNRDNARNMPSYKETEQTCIHREHGHNKTE